MGLYLVSVGLSVSASAGERAADLGEAGGDAAVDDLVTDTHDQAAADGRVDRVPHLDPAAVQLGQLVGQRALLLRRSSARR